VIGAEREGKICRLRAVLALIPEDRREKIATEIRRHVPTRFVLGKGLPQMAFALGITGWIGLCRLLRGETLRQSERPYCEAARALGQSNPKIIFRHILPNVMHLVLINFVLGFSGIVLAESILSYIGVGMPIGTASWGAMIDSARMELVREPKVWWNICAASGALFFFVLCLNLFGDALRRAFDPAARRIRPRPGSSSSAAAGSGTALICPRISPLGKVLVWMLK